MLSTNIAKNNLNKNFQKIFPKQMPKKVFKKWDPLHDALIPELFEWLQSYQ
jgi:hypothetical protein